jgi:hypothetical protein
MKWRWAYAVLAACSGAGSGPSTEIHDLTLSTNDLHLSAPLGVTTTASLTATNENAVPTYAVPELSDFARPEFALSGTDCPDELSPGASCSVTVAFTPDYVGDAGEDSSLELGNSFATLTGNGEVALTISPATQDFGVIYIDVNSAPFAFTIQNTTAVAQHPTTKLVNTLDWGFAIADSTCAEIPPMGSCSLSVVLQAGVDGARSATLDVDGADAALTGTILKIASPQLYHEGTGDFGDVGIYAMPDTRLISIVNGTHMDLSQIDVGIAGASSAAFVIQSNSCTNPIADGGSCYLEVRANPTGLGMASAMLIAQTPGIPVHSMSLSANFIDDGPRIAIAPSGSVAFSADQQISFTITNPSMNLRYIDSVTVAAPYQISNDNCPGNVVPIDNSLACHFTIQLLGSSGGDAHQLLTVAWDEGQQDTVMLVPAN